MGASARTSTLDDLSQARVLIERRQYPEAWRLLEPRLLDNPDDVPSLVVANYFHIRTANYPLAYLLSRRVSELAPRDPVAWMNLAQACKFVQREKEGERAARQGLACAKKPDDQATLYTNLSGIYIDAGRFAEAEVVLKKALAIDPDNGKLKSNLGMCQLALHNWSEGWKNYRHFIGTEERIRQIYNEPPEAEWDGGFGQTVLLYGDQGIGDEICFASMVADALDRCGKLILNIDKRLTGLFKRSFPKVRVYGNRDLTVAKGAKWSKDDTNIDASLPLSQVGEFFRLTDEDFPSEPYLKADPDRTFMWKSLFKAKGKPAIGLSWTGGLWHTGSKFRAVSLEQLLPVFQSMDAHWVGLQYKDASAEIEAFRAKHPDIDLVQYPHATLTQDYDDTAALVAALDHVISVPTAVVHLAAALGTKCIAMASPKPCWKFHGPRIAFHPAVKLIYHRRDWDTSIQDAVLWLTKYSSMRRAA